MYRSRAIGELSTTADHLPDLRERLQPERVFPQEGPRHPLAQLHLSQVLQKVPKNISNLAFVNANDGLSLR